MAEAVWESPLRRNVSEGLGVAVCDGGARAMIDVRLAPDDAEGRTIAATILGVPLPTDPRTSARSGEVRALWLSIDQWLIVGPRQMGPDLAARLRQGLEARFASVVDMSDARCVLCLEGPGAREIVMKGAAADLTGPTFPPGAVRRMNFAGIAAMAHYHSADPESLDLYVFRSYAAYAWRWLEAAARKGSEPRLFRTATPPPV